MREVQLTVPALDPAPDPKTITKPGQLKQWVEDLPYAHPEGMAREILSTLQRLNRHSKISQQRLELMELLLAPYFNILQIFKEKILKRGSASLQRNNRLFFDLVEKINLEMAYGFKRIIKDELLTDLQKSPEQHAGSIYWAMYCLIQAILLDLCSYQQESRSVWREILQLFQLATMYNIADQPIQTSIQTMGESPRIITEFKQILLLFSLDPLHLSLGDLWASYTFLSHWASIARLGRMPERDNPMESLLVDLRGIDKIKPFSPEQKVDVKRYCLLVTSPLSKSIDHSLALIRSNQLEKVKGLEGLSKAQAQQLLQRMLLFWRAHPLRGFPRREQYDRLMVVAGIDAINDFLRKGTAHADYRKHRAQRSEELEGTDVSTSFTPAPREIRHHTHHWRQLNISERGIGVVVQQSGINGFPIGQLVLIESESAVQHTSWRLGVVRRLIQQNSEMLELGVEFLVGKAFAATLRPEVFGAERRADFLPALVMKQNENSERTLITPPMTYRPDRQYVLETTDGETSKVLAGNLLESTGSFERFSCTQVQLHG
jgi:hypothetical protein